MLTATEKKETVDARRAVARVISKLSPSQLNVAKDFLTFLYFKKDDATLEVLANKKLSNEIRSAQADLQTNRRSKFVAWNA